MGDTVDGYSTLDIPILHADWAGEYDINTCFLNPSLMRVSELVTPLLDLYPSISAVCRPHPRA